jgi:hypothetical protein
MIGFNKYLVEAKNTHMEHLEDNVLNGGVDGARQSINFLQSLRDMLAGNSNVKLNTTVKWDGAPAVFAGIDPRDGKFFVAKKGIFNKNPKVYKTEKEVRADTSGDLADKLAICLKYLPELGIKGVIQGDLMFTQSDLRTQEIGGESCVTFHPNTIVYAVPTKTKLAKQIQSAKMGIVWHTTYTGSSFETMKASFGKNIKSKLKASKNVWFDDATYRDVTGTATMTQTETEEVTKVLSRAGTLFQTIKPAILNGFANDEELLIMTKTFNNSKIRMGQPIIDNGASHVRGLVQFITDKFQKDEDSKKTEAGKQAVRERKQRVLKFFSNNDPMEIAKVFDLMKLLVEAKIVIVSKMNKAEGIGTFLKTAVGFMATSQEGYVAIDHTGKNAVKIVDRLEFSRANFSPDILKGWQR